MDRSQLQTLNNPFVGLISPGVLRFDKRERRWNEREAKLRNRAPDKYGLGFGWRVFAIRNKQTNIMQVAVYYRGLFAFAVLDVVPAMSGFALRLSSTSSRKHGEYNTRLEAIKCGKDWMIKNPSYTRRLCKEYLKGLL